MLFFGLSFILYALQLTGRNGFWKNLWNADITTHKSAIPYQKILQKYVKAKLDIEFLKKCKSADVYSKFVRWKHVKTKTKKENNKLYKANLNDAIKASQNNFRKLQQHVDLQTQLRQSTTWLKYHSILFSINRLQSKKIHLIELWHQQKHDNLIIENDYVIALKEIQIKLSQTLPILPWLKMRFQY